MFRSALETIGLLNKEVELYGRGLVMKPFVLLLNKIDYADGEEVSRPNKSQSNSIQFHFRRHWSSSNCSPLCRILMRRPR